MYTVITEAAKIDVKSKKIALSIKEQLVKQNVDAKVVMIKEIS